MIKVSCNWGKTECELKGSLATLCADTATILKAIYEKIKARDEDMAEEWKHQFDEGNIQRCVFDPEGVEKEVNEADNKMAMISELLEFLQDMLDNDDDDDEEDEEND